MISQHKSVQCILHSVLAKAAKLKEYSEIKYLDYDDKEAESSGIIIDIINFHNDEFLILNNGVKIKLDCILELNGKKCTEEFCNIHFRQMNIAKFSSNN